MKRAKIVLAILILLLAVMLTASIVTTARGLRDAGNQATQSESDIS